jgi:hypothetical protein
MEDLPHCAEAFALQRGRCFRFVAEAPRQQGQPAPCPRPVARRGTFRVPMAATTASRPALGTLDRSAIGGGKKRRTARYAGRGDAMPVYKGSDQLIRYDLMGARVAWAKLTPEGWVISDPDGDAPSRSPRWTRRWPALRRGTSRSEPLEVLGRRAEASGTRPRDRRVPLVSGRSTPESGGSSCRGLLRSWSRVPLTPGTAGY